MKRLLCAFFIIIVCAAALCGCSAVSYDGKEEIARARKLHTELEGADIVMTDNISGEVVQKISYLFIGDVMTYMYEGHADGKSYYEFNNGTELNWITLPDEERWSFAAKGSENYYNYSRIGRHYYADGEKLFAVYEAAVTGTERRGDTLIFSYDIGRLKEYEAFAEMGELSDFSMSYTFDAQGRCTSFTNGYTLDGQKYSYTVAISERSERVKRTEIPEISNNAQKDE